MGKGLGLPAMLNDKTRYLSCFRHNIESFIRGPRVVPNPWYCMWTSGVDNNEINLCPAGADRCRVPTIGSTGLRRLDERLPKSVA